MCILNKSKRDAIIDFISKIRKRVMSKFTKNKYILEDDLSSVCTGSSDLAKVFEGKVGNQVHKWHHYFDIYERHLGHFRGKEFRLLEIGVFRGGSLEMWREYFGESAIIYGIDIDPECARFDGVAGSVRIGSQTDTEFLSKVVEEMGGVDVVIDDGSHDSLHIKKSFDTLFDKMSNNGIYIAEDLHCCYWPAYSGGYYWPWSFINRAKRMIDDMHHWYHGRGERTPALRKKLRAIHFYDSVIVLEKGVISPPVTSLRPVESNSAQDPGA